MAGPPRTRRELLAASAVMAAGAGVACSAPAALAATGDTRPDPPDERVRRLLSVELLLQYCYRHVLGTSLPTPNARSVLELQVGHEQAHIRALGAELTRLSPSGAVPVPPAGVAVADRDLARRNVAGRIGQLQGEKDALHLLLELERVVGGAYFVALTKLEDPRLIGLAMSIMGTEAQHEALIGDLLYPGDAQKSVPYGLIQGIQ